MLFLGHRIVQLPLAMVARRPALSCGRLLQMDASRVDIAERHRQRNKISDVQSVSESAVDVPRQSHPPFPEERERLSVSE